MNNNELEQIAQQIVESQCFSFLNFEEAKAHFEFSINHEKYYIDYDRFTLFHYDSNLPYTMYHMLYSFIQTQFLKTLNRETEKCHYEYLALLWFTRCCSLYYPIIKKTNRPDFQIIDLSGRSIGVEVIELTSEEDKKRMSIMKKHLNHNDSETLNQIKEILGKDVTKFNIAPLGSSLSLFPKEVTCLTSQRQNNAIKLIEKYYKYVASEIAGDFDEFIILGDALRSELAITEEYEVDEIFSALKIEDFKENTSFVILFHDHKNGKIHSKCIPAK